MTVPHGVSGGHFVSVQIHSCLPVGLEIWSPTSNELTMMECSQQKILRTISSIFLSFPSWYHPYQFYLSTHFCLQHNGSPLIPPLPQDPYLFLEHISPLIVLFIRLSSY